VFNYGVLWHREQGIPLPHLIVVPLSTLPNWERELAKWAPQLYVVCMKGNGAARATVKKYDCYMSDPDTDGNSSVRKRSQRKVRFHVMLATYETVLQVRPMRAVLNCRE
jgi:chromodomain-helicase-DNA-binding protein 1